MKKFSKACFFSGAHFDIAGRLAAPAIAGVSNPGHMERHPGGASLNAASIASALRLSCMISSPIGRDVDGAALREIVKARGIADALFEVENVATGTYTAIMQPDGEMVIGLADLDIYERAAAKDYLQADGGPVYDANAWFLPANLAQDVIAETSAKADGKLLAMASISPAKSVRLEPVLPRCDLLFTNRSEAMAITGLADADCDQLARELSALGAKAGTISNGSGALTWWDGHETGRLQGETIASVADVNGAGDALAGAALAALAQDRPLASAIRYGMAAARLVIKNREPFMPGLDWAALEAEAMTIKAV